MATSVPSLPDSFRRLAWSNLLAQSSEQIALAAAPLAAVLLLAAGPSETGWLQMAQTLPFLLLSIPAGILADRASRRALMAGSEMLRTISLAAIATILAFDALNLPMLAVLGFVGAMGTVCYSVAAPALVPVLVPRTQLAQANRWLELARSGAYVAGPALGGALVGRTGAPTAYVLATILSLLTVLLLAGLPNEDGSRRQERNPMHDLKEGADFILRHDLLRPILATAVFFNTGWFMLQAVFVAYAVQVLGMTAAEVGMSLGIYGGGMIVGAVIAPFLSRRVAFGTLILLGPIAGFGAALTMMLTMWLPAVWMVGLSFFLFGSGPILWSISTMTLRQSVTPNALLGRVSAFIMTASFGARPLGAAIGAAIAANAGVGICLLAIAACFLVQLVIIAASRVPRLLEVPEAA